MAEQGSGSGENPGGRDDRNRRDSGHSDRGVGGRHNGGAWNKRESREGRDRWEGRSGPGRGRQADTWRRGDQGRKRATGQGRRNPEGFQGRRTPGHGGWRKTNDTRNDRRSGRQGEKRETGEGRWTSEGYQEGPNQSKDAGQRRRSDHRGGQRRDDRWNQGRSDKRWSRQAGEREDRWPRRNDRASRDGAERYDRKARRDTERHARSDHRWGTREGERGGDTQCGQGEFRERPRSSRRRDDHRPEPPARAPQPGTAPAKDEPPTPTEGYDESLLPVGVRAELKGVPKDLADTIGAHILAAGQLLEIDPEQAYRHAEAARRRAGRLPAVREATAEAAYAAGHYEVALREFRAIRRMNGGDELLPVLADCERALGRHHAALELLATLDPKTKRLGLRIECLLVEAGIRADLGQRGEALRLLKSAIAHKIGPRQGQARLRYAYADLLESAGQAEAAREWFDSAARLDADLRLDAADRIARLDGVVLPDDFEFDTDEPDESADGERCESPDPDADEAAEAPGENSEPDGEEAGDLADSGDPPELQPLPAPSSPPSRKTQRTQPKPR